MKHSLSSVKIAHAYVRPHASRKYASIIRHDELLGRVLDTPSSLGTDGEVHFRLSTLNIISQPSFECTLPSPASAPSRPLRSAAMSLSAPSRRLVSRCMLCHRPLLPLLSPPDTDKVHVPGTHSYTLPIRTTRHHQRRLASSKDSSKDGNRPNPILDEFRRNNPDAFSARRGSEQQMQAPEQGDIAPSSIFEDDRRVTQQQTDGPSADNMVEDGKVKVGGVMRDPKNILRVTQPDPAAREKWLRKKVIQLVRKGGRLNKQEFLKRTEREHLVKSHNMKTSVKKLGMIARQIAGKTMDDAITQMRFSKKKVAVEVLKQLEAARDEAIVMRGMGLPLQEGQPELLNESSSSIAGTTNPARSEPDREQGPVQIQLKDGKKHKVASPSNIYIDQAWVGRGPYGSLPDYRARGRVFKMRTPWTSLSVVLKEEATRIREHAEREEKRKRKVNEKVWVHLPDRPIQIQRQWYSW